VTKKALVLGIDDYVDLPLNGCVNDAIRIASVLQDATCGFEVRTLLNEQVTRGSVRACIQWLFENASSSILYFAGHGWKTPISTYVVTHDATEYEEGVDFLWLAAAANRLATPAQSVVFILDCCHSGDATPRAKKFGSQEPISIGDITTLGGAGRAVLAACRGSELALELQFQGTVHGAFTHFLCVALQGEAADDRGVVTLNAAFDYVAFKLAESGRQTPVLKGDQEGVLLLATGVAKTGDWKPASKQRLSLREAQSRAAELATDAHQIVSGAPSYDAWRSGGYADACRRFEPIHTWFTRRRESQPDLLKDPTYKQHDSSCHHFYEKLCAFEEDFQLRNGKVRNRIGSGGFGSVWRVEGASWQHEVCFKSFHSNDLLDADKVSRFRRGFEAMRQLDHPNIVKVQELSELPFGFYMDYVKGPNLRTLRPGSALEPAQVVDVLFEVAETLKHAHGRGVIHRDVKPENILVEVTDDADYVGHLTDFDLAWFTTATQVTKMAEGFGSHFYAAPEQINSPQGSAAHRSTVDSYSFGQLCFYAVCNRDPQAFDHENNARTLAEELGKHWNDAGASGEFHRLYVDCTRRNPKDRVADFREIAERLAAVGSSLERVGEEYDSNRFMQQLAFNLSGKIGAATRHAAAEAIRSRSGRTEISIIWAKDAPKVCALEVSFRPDELHFDGLSSANTRALLNQRIDTMLRDHYKAYDAERRGAKGGGFEISVRFDHIPKEIKGVLKARELISRVIDILEQA
jgi:eukaryotic-like serine/threonine-protein kinase